DGGRTPLPAPSVDTGMGLERAAVILQSKNNIYETDLFVPIIDRIGSLTGKPYGTDTETDYAIRVVAEHARAASFLIGDGVVPGNEGRGYVLRRVIRRAIRYGRQLGLEGPFLTQVVAEVISHFSPVYKELSENQEFIQRVVGLEEERFAEAIQTGLPLLEDGFIPLRKLLLENPKLGTLAADDVSTAVATDSVAGSIPTGILEIVTGALQTGLPQGADAQREFIQTLSDVETFTLYDTYGFPPELTAEIAREHGLEVDMAGFEREMEAQKQQSRSSASFSGGMEMQSAYEELGVGPSEFVGYALTQQDSAIAAILSGGVSVDHATQGQQVEVIISQSPFYAEGGGQLGDRGTISGSKGVMYVEDTQSPVAGLIVQRGTVQQGDISVGESVTAQVELDRRLDSSRNHSGTHILHAALRSVLGPHVRQAGSLCAPERLRFDFSHVSALTKDELLSVQSLSNDKVRGNLNVTSHETSYSEAVREGALAFFGDRYGDVVRVVTMANGDKFSVEVCGGTHVAATGQVGTLVVLGESSIGGGMRRIEAVTGRAAEELFVQQNERLEALSQKLQTPVADLEARLDSFMEENDALKKQLEGFQKTSLRGEAEELLGKVQDVDGVQVVAGRTSADGADGMREMGDFLKDKLGSVVVALAAVVEGSPILITMVTPDLVERGLHAGNIARDTAKVMGGGGGGRPEMAQAGGKQPEKVDEALDGVPALVRQGLS
ncbi:MAG TPA: alanine--tRNA ligase, partial [Dehalococcoidia bacterium]|nr:alanine--tRNA ligase [Dehalococcoidia bacterium]